MSYNSLFSFVSFRRPEEFVSTGKLEPFRGSPETDGPSLEGGGSESGTSDTFSDETEGGSAESADVSGSTEYEAPERPSTELLDRFVKELKALDAADYDSWASVKIDVHNGGDDSESISLKEYWRSNDPQISAERGKVRRALLRGGIDPSSWEARTLRAAALLSTGRRVPDRVFRAYIEGHIRSGTKPPPPDPRTDKPQQTLSKRGKRLQQIKNRLRQIREAKDRVRYVRRNLNLMRAKGHQTIPQRQERTLWQRITRRNPVEFVPEEQPQLDTKKIIVRGLLGNNVPRDDIQDDVTYEPLRRELGSETLHSIFDEPEFDDAGESHETHLPTIQPSRRETAIAVSGAEWIGERWELAYIDKSALEVLDSLYRTLDGDACTLIREANELKYLDLINDPSEDEHTSSKVTFATLAPSKNQAVRLAGVGDLITVEEKLKRYVTGEISHIANTISGVMRKRRHALKVSDEETVETFRLTEEEARRSLETNTRTELSATASETAREQFAIRAGVTASGTYGVTTVEASMEASYQRKRSESNSIAQTKAREVISKTEERTKSVQRELRRSVSKRESTEENKEEFKGEETASHLYVWLEQEREVRLLNKGSRVFVEFYVPEPAVDLRKPINPVNSSQPPPDFNISAAEISEQNYQAYASFFGAQGVEPPPPEFVEVPFSISTETDREVEYGIDVKEEKVNMPTGYIADRIRISGYGYDFSNTAVWFVTVGGQRIFLGPNYMGYYENSSFAMVIGEDREGSPAEIELTDRHEAPQGTRVSVIVHGHRHKAAAVNGFVICRRACDTYASWQLRAFSAIRQAHQNMMEEYERASAGFGPQREEIGGPASQNRETEKRELRKWCKQLLGVTPPNETAYEPGDPWSVLDPNIASKQRFLSTFFDQAFEWQEMTYFLLDYDVAPVDRWSVVRGSYSSDPRHTDFLQAGAARVLVPITPLFETVIAQYMLSDHVPTTEDIQHWLSGWFDGITDDESPETEDSEEGSEQEGDSDNVYGEDINLLLELLVARNPDVVMGSGKLSLENGKSTAKLIESLWEPDHIDKGRKIYIEDSSFVIRDIGAENGTPVLTLDKAWNGETRDDYNFAIEAVQVGDSWTITLPTQLIMLFDKETEGALNGINDQIAEGKWPDGQ